MTAALAERPHYVYRYYAADGTPLYIGCTSNLARREAQHRNTKAWFSQVARRDVQEFENRFAGITAERALIQHEQPLHNVLTKYEERPTDGFWFRQAMEIAADPTNIRAIIGKYMDEYAAIQSAEYDAAIAERKYWIRVRRRLRESKYRAAYLARKSA